MTVGDADHGGTDTDTLTITLAGNGTLADGAGFSGLNSSSGSDGIYTLSGAAAAITSELQALEFTPVDGVPNTSATTTFTLSDRNNFGTGRGRCWRGFRWREQRSIATGTMGLPSGSDARSVFGWVQYTGGSTGYYDIFDYGTLAANEIPQLVVNNGKLYFGGDANDFGSTLAVTPNAWHFVGYTYDAGATSVTLYVDGISQTGALTSGGSPTGEPLNTVVTASDIGNQIDVPGPSWLGSIANLQVYDTALSSSQALSLYDSGISGSPIIPGDAVAWWSLNGNANDFSGNGNDGTAQNVTFATVPLSQVPSVIDTDPSVAPTITGTVAGQETTSEAPVTPFAAVTISDANNGGTNTDTLAITLSGSGTLADGAGFHGLSFSNGSYSLSGTAAAITTELHALVFTPVNGVPNTAVTTTFTLSDSSSAGTTSLSDSTTTVIDSDPPPSSFISFNDGQINESQIDNAFTPQISIRRQHAATDGRQSDRGRKLVCQQPGFSRRFTASFDYQATPSGGGLADGFAFILQDSSAGLSALGGDGGELGYGPNNDNGRGGTAISPSAAVDWTSTRSGGS